MKNLYSFQNQIHSIRLVPLPTLQMMKLLLRTFSSTADWTSFSTVATDAVTLVDFMFLTMLLQELISVLTESFTEDFTAS